MLSSYPFKSLGHADHGWLDARHHFSFGGYYNPERMGFGSIRVINDDIIKPGKGFEMHPHKNMEIITFVRSGAITHRDNKGNIGRTKAGDVQVMSAGTGIFHSEFNLEAEDTNIYQIWIEPNQDNVTPRWDSHEFPGKTSANQLMLLVSGDEDAGAPLQIYQDADIYAGTISAGTSIKHAIKHQAYLLVSSGRIDIDGQPFSKGDGAEVFDQESLTISAVDDSELILIDAPR